MVYKRLSELNYVVEKEYLGEIQKASERLAFYAGKLEQEVRNNTRYMKNKTTDDFRMYQKILTTLRDKFPANSSFWMLMQHDINTLNILSDNLK